MLTAEQRKDMPLVRYAVKNRYGCIECYVTRPKAVQAARAEGRDGWPTQVRDMWTDTIIYRTKE